MIYLLDSPADQVFVPSGIVVMSYISDPSILCQPAADKTPREEPAAVGAPLYTSLHGSSSGPGTADCHKGEMQEPLE